MSDYPPPPPPPGTPPPGTPPPPGGPYGGSPYGGPPYGGLPPGGPYGGSPYGGGPVYPQGKPPEPQSVKTAVILMYIGAALSVVGIVLDFANKSAIRRAVEKAYLKNPNPKLTVTQLTNVALVAAVVVGVISIALWLWMAYANSKGKNWARITGTVFWGISLIGILADLARPNAGATRIGSIIVFLLGGAVVFFLWQKDASEYFKPSTTGGAFG